MKDENLTKSKSFTVNKSLQSLSLSVLLPLSVSEISTAVAAVLPSEVDGLGATAGTVCTTGLTRGATCTGGGGLAGATCNCGGGLAGAAVAASPSSSSLSGGRGATTCTGGSLVVVPCLPS